MSNNNNDNDLDIEPFDDAGFDDYNNKKGTLGDVWRNNPMVKIGVILAAVAVLLGGLMLFGGSEEKTLQSAVGTASDVTEAPGTSEVSETTRQAIEDRNMENAETALREGGAVVPIPMQPSRDPLPLPVEETSEEDPLERWRRMQEERVRQQQALEQASPAAAQKQEEPPVDTKTPAVNAMSQSMATQMQAILQNKNEVKVQHKEITKVTFMEEKQKSSQAAQAMGVAGGNSRNQNLLSAEEEQVEDIIIPAGTIEYGQLLIEANTDAPGPVMAQIVSGPLRGGRVIGSFTSTDNYLVLNFSTVVIDGIDYPVKAVAIDPDTTLPGVITEIDRRYFKRIILPMAAEFVKGLTEAISESGTTSVYISDTSVTQSTADKDSQQEVASGVSEAGDKLSEILDEEADNTEIMLRVAAGTPVGILFVAPVIDTSLASR